MSILPFVVRKHVCGRCNHVLKAAIASMQVKYSSNKDENVQKLYNAFGKPQVMFGLYFRIQTP